MTDVLMANRLLSRRAFLRAAGGVAGGVALGGCFSSTTVTDASAGSSDDPWRRHAGMTLQFISENTAPTSAIAANLQPFTDRTGITVQITQLQLDGLVQKVALDFASGRASYHVIYADPYQVLAPYRLGLAELNQFLDTDLPDVPGGVDDFIPTQLDAAGRFSDPEILYALPYDCPTMIWMYRRDLFEQHAAAMQDALGFDPMPSAQTTWQQYRDIARWFNDNADEVSYGCGHQAKQHDSLMCDFSNVLWSFGGAYFEESDVVGRIGKADPGDCLLGSDAAIEAAQFYADLLSIAHPSSTSWDWTGVDEAFRAGEIAMVPNWHEFAAGIESGDLGGGRVGYAPLPTGPDRAADMYGGTGLAINANASREEQEAAWLFLVWATSPETQLEGLKSEAGGGTPTRTSVYEMEEVQQAASRPSELPNMLTYEAVQAAWEDDRIGLRPKIPSWNECDVAFFTALSQMLAGKDPARTMREVAEEINSITDRVRPA